MVNCHNSKRIKTYLCKYCCCTYHWPVIIGLGRTFFFIAWFLVQVMGWFGYSANLAFSTLRAIFNVWARSIYPKFRHWKPKAKKIALNSNKSIYLHDRLVESLSWLQHKALHLLSAYITSPLRWNCSHSPQS